jgi:hypothetical protein
MKRATAIRKFLMGILEIVIDPKEGGQNLLESV